MSVKKRLMIFCDAYLPGERGGGGMWAVRNLAERFSERYDFYIVTRDCDGRIDATPYTNVPRNKWIRRPEANIYYASPSHLKSKHFAKLVEDVEPDGIYLNSVLSKPCVRFLFARRFYLKKHVPLLLASCGEFSPAALRLSLLKKRCFLFLGNVLGLFQNIVWKAATDKEREDIEREMGRVPIKVAPELSPKDILPDFRLEEKPEKEPGSLRLVFFSRVTTIKNLDFLLSLLHQFKAGKISLDVVGPTDDSDYLKRCESIAAALPKNISVNFLGSLERDAALEAIKTAHFMTLPSKSENFGYVVIESLAAGCPVILSDQVGWTEILGGNAGWLLPLSSPKDWTDVITHCLEMNGDDYRKRSFSAREFAVSYLTTEEPTTVNQLMFDSILAAPLANG